MVTVTRANFLEQSNDLIRHLPSAAFVSLDEEMTGITLPSSAPVASQSSSKLGKDQTAQQRYQHHLKPVAERYSIIQLGICLFHQHPDYDPNISSHDGGEPEFIVRRYNFFLFPSAGEGHRQGKAVAASTREVVLNPSSIAFLQQHNMDFNTWMQAGVPYAVESQAQDYIHAYLIARQRDYQQQQQNQSYPVVAAGVAQSNAPTTNTNPALVSNNGRIELHRSEDIKFFARTMASLREWLDAKHAPPSPPSFRQLGPRGTGVAGEAGVNHRRREDAEEMERALNEHGNNDNTAIAIADLWSSDGGRSFLLPPCNSFLRRALYENIRLEYPALLLELAGPQHPNQIRVWRLNEEERMLRQVQLERDAWEKLIVDQLGMWRIFHALSLANRGELAEVDEENDDQKRPHPSSCSSSIALAESWMTAAAAAVPKSTKTAATTTPPAKSYGCYHVPIVVHNGLMDVLFLMTHFVQWQLPTSYLELKQMMHLHFPLIYDTKLMSTECCMVSTWINSTTTTTAAPAAHGNNNIHNDNDDVNAVTNPNYNRHANSTPAASSTVLATLYNKVIVQPDLTHMFRFAPTAQSNRLFLEPQGRLFEDSDVDEAEQEQLHQASYDAYMTGAVFVGLCQAIMRERQYTYDETSHRLPSQQHRQQRVASLRFLLSPPPVVGNRNLPQPSVVDDQIKWLFGRNKLYSMMAMFTVDLECLEYGSVDPLRRGMSTTSTFRVSGIDPSVATRDVVRCLSHLTDARGQQVNFEIVWVDDTTFMVAASYLPKILVKPSIDIVHEHGQIILGRLRSRFTKETIVTLQDYWQIQERREPLHSDHDHVKRPSSGMSFWNRIWIATARLFGGDSSNNKRKQEIVSGDGPVSKRARVD